VKRANWFESVGFILVDLVDIEVFTSCPVIGVRTLWRKAFLVELTLAAAPIELPATESVTSYAQTLRMHQSISLREAYKTSTERKRLLYQHLLRLTVNGAGPLA